MVIWAGWWFFIMCAFPTPHVFFWLGAWEVEVLSFQHVNLYDIIMYLCVRLQELQDYGMSSCCMWYLVERFLCFHFTCLNPRVQSYHQCPFGVLGSSASTITTLKKLNSNNCIGSTVTLNAKDSVNSDHTLIACA